MKNLVTFLFFCCSISLLEAQEYFEIRNPEVIQGVFRGETVALRDFRPDPNFPNEIVKTERLGYHPKKDWPLHNKVNPNALPLGLDPAWQANYAAAGGEKALGQNYNGQGYTSVNPSDPNMDVGPNHVIQMINAGSGARFQVWNKAGVSLSGPNQFDTFFGFPGGLGDPIVLYDQLADRWLMSEFAASSNTFLVAISTTPDPLGTWYMYTFNTPQFPDYPKYSVWPTAYFVTTNESTPAIYALDRNRMLAGLSATMQRFSTPSYPTIGFQATTPVGVEGPTAPPVGSPGMFMRMADDAWSAMIPNDRLEIYTMAVDFITPANTVFAGPTFLNTQPFDTELNGYVAFAAFPQPGSGIKLDPLREVLMYQIQYRNFGTHESIVCNHVTDVDGTDRGGVRWYELRRTGGGPWSIYQQGTYSPDVNSRWMAAIAINGDGDIGLMYNISSTTVYPGIRYTGRKACDPLGQMTEPETTIVSGAAANGSNRWGDYNSLSVDPSNETSFWGTAQYNPTSQWSTRIASFSLSGGACCDLAITNISAVPETCPNANNGSITITAGTSNGPITYSIAGPVNQSNNTGSFTNLPDGNYSITLMDNFNCSVTSSATVAAGVDNTPPMAMCASQTITFNGQPSIPLNVNTLVTASDNCGVQSIVLSPASITCMQVGQTVPVLATVTDVNGNPATCTSQITVTGLPCGWSQQPDGVNCTNGNSIAYNSATQVFTATSTDCYYDDPFTSDELAFAQRTLCGDGSITAQVTGINGNSLGWAGVIMRESNAGGAKKVQLTTNMNSNLSRREIRTTTNGQAYPQQFPAQNRFWLRIVRQGNQFIGYTSPNGVQWYQTMIATVSMSSCIQIGLVLSNYEQNSTVSATFANVSYTGSGGALAAFNNNGFVEESYALLDFVVFPNPTTGVINVDLSQYLGKPARLEVCNLLGQVLQAITIEEVLNTEQLDLSTYQNGMYLLRLRTDGLPDVTKRITLERFKRQ